MNPRIKRLLSMLLALTMVFSLTAPVSASAASTTAASGNTVEIEVGESKKLSSSGWLSKTTWTSSDETVATVSSNGTVTGVAEGTATITATSKSLFFFFGGSTKTTTYTVVVTEGTPEVPTEPEETEPEEGLTVKAGEKLQLEVNANGGTVTWKSSNKNIATVDNNGLVTGVSEGTVTITATVKKTTGGNGFWFFWWGSKTTTTTTEFEVTVLPGDEEPTEPEVPSEPEESKPIVENPMITLQTNESLVYNPQNDEYVLSGAMDVLNGTMSNSIGITTVMFEVRFNNQTVAMYSFEPTENWTIENFGAMPGENILHFLMTDINGEEWEQNITLICDSEENMDAIIEDSTADLDTDTIPDYIEELFGTNSNSDDTDSDGLSDDVEATILGCDARYADTDADGISDGDEDPDGDGLTNLIELSIRTDPCRFDTDGDALTDYDEVNKYKTDPLSMDTDSDNLDDGWEIRNGTDPLITNEMITVQDSVQMGECTADIIVDLPGGMAHSLTVEASDIEILQSGIPGQLSAAVDLSTRGELTENGATLSFQIPEDYPHETTDDFIPVIYYFNEALQLLEEIPTTYSNGIAQAHLEHFSTYILLNKVVFDEVWNNEIRAPGDDSSDMTGLDIVLVIDSSGSMTSNDGQNLRIAAAKEFVAKLSENDRAAVVDFDNYSNLYQSFTNDHDLLNSAIDRVDSSGGTSLSAGMNLALQQFISESYTRTDAYKYIIFLTDGEGSYSNSYTNTAIENGIVVYTIGLGSGVDEALLRQIAESTGGKYFFASTADALLSVYEDVSFETVDYSADTNEDGISDYHTRLIADGILLNGVGKRYFTGAITDIILELYPNCININELIYQAIQSNADFDGDGLLNGDELVITTSGNRVYVTMVSDPTMANSDADPFTDNLEVKLEGSPFAYDIQSSDLNWLINDDCYTASWSARDYVDSGWYRFRLGLGNYVFGGEYDWSYAAQKQLLSSAEDYAQNVLDSYEALYLAENFMTITNDFMSEVNNYLSTYANISAPASDHATIREILGYMSELSEAKKKLGTMDLSDLNKVREQCEDIGALYSKIDKSTGELSNIDFTQYDSLNKISVKVPAWATKAGKAADKVGKVLSYITATINSVDSVCSTISGYAALTATDQAYVAMYDVLKDLYCNSEIGFVTIAAGELMLSVESQYIKMASEIKLALEDVMYSWDEVAIDVILVEAGPIGWAVAIGRALVNLISGIGETSKQHIYMIAAGDAGNSSGKLLKNSMVETDEFYNETTERTIDFMLICATMRIAGEEKTIDSSKAQSWLFKKINDHDSVVSFCESQIETVRSVLKDYGLSVK